MGKSTVYNGHLPLRSLQHQQHFLGPGGNGKGHLFIGAATFCAVKPLDGHLLTGHLAAVVVDSARGPLEKNERAQKAPRCIRNGW